MLLIETGRGNPILRKKSLMVEKIDKLIIKFIDKMVLSMKQERGVGLAAPQVGQNIKIIVVQLYNPQGKMGSVVEMINPNITWYSKEEDIDVEGCLSVPGEWGKVQRPVAIKVSYMNKKSVQQKLELKGLNARIVQHEYDHLQGILFVDKAVEMLQPNEVGDVKI